MSNAVNELKMKGHASREAARKLAKISGEVKHQALLSVADSLVERQSEIVEANEKDYKLGQRNGLSEALLDRLILNQERLEIIAGDVRNIAKQPDPVGEISDMRTMPNGLQIGRRRVPLGVIGVIYESRPNVTVDVSMLCLKSGNAVILRGGKESIHSNSVLTRVIRDSIESSGAPEDAVQLVESTDRALVGQMLKMKETIDLIIPRGSQDLIQRVSIEATIPAITGGVGVCHTYVDKDADVEMALNVVNNAKTQRPSVCNALDSLIVHSNIAPIYLPRMASKWAKSGVEMRCDRRALSLVGSIDGLQVIPAAEEDWGTEFLSLRVAVKIVDSLEEAMEHIECYGSGHTEAIITEDDISATRFLQEVDSGVVMVNASTYFNDGAQFGLGSEVAISTNKIHARGPVGLRELTSYKWIVMGTGQIRT